jgi:nucleoside-diphosphate-sugar epimerase
LGTGIETRILDLAEAIKDIIGVQRKTQLRIVNLPSVPGEVKRNFTNFSKANHLLDWAPDSPLSDGLRTTLDFFT